MSDVAWRTVPTLVGRHVTLRPLDRADRADLLAAFSGLTQVFATAIPGPATIDPWFDTLEAQQAAGRALPFTLLAADGQVAGATRLLRMNLRYDRVEIGGTLYARRVQRTALSTEMKRLLLGHAFDMLGCQCVQVRANWRNPDSRAAIERLGARKDGVLRWHTVSGTGEVRDTVVYSILSHEWPENQSRPHAGARTMTAITDLTVTAADGAPVPLDRWRGQVLLIVNTASKCGFTPQYEGLEALHRRFADRGFAVLGFPCNQFGAQEPGDAAEIANFCSLTYDVTFPIFAKIDVNGAHAAPLFKRLKAEAPGVLGTKAVKWNFTKFLVDRDGKVVRRYAPTTKPEEITADIEALL